uniref:Desmoglein-2-like n=1 Tax=Labrus bergylta TaxID=56723 RepID=A0A3Q3FSP1_9LABR
MHTNTRTHTKHTHTVECAAECSALVFVSVEGHGFNRQKREWIIAPRKLKENHDYTGLESIARIRSDKENFTEIRYYLTGPGVDQPPEGVFQVDHKTGYVKIFSILDREQIPFYYLKGVAKYMDGTLAEKDIDLKITVVDENDCPPIIAAQQVGSVKESSAAGTSVIVTDADEENSINSRISYSIVGQSNTAGMFFMNSQTGEVMVRQNTLDREVKQDSYRLTISASDLNGLPGGNTGTGEIEIRILDINDNLPTLEKESYEGSVEENTINVEVMRIKALDMDLIYSENWLAVFEIISGNEGGYFSISTDSKTNEGIIMINKALDYEEIKTLNLRVAVSNKAAYNFGSSSVSGGSTTSKNYPIKINVVNQKEGPRFQPSVKVVTISEDRTSVSLNQVITTYAAIDSDTLLTATNVRYAKIRDDDNWLIIDSKTADIRLNKLPDRESKFLINGTYYAKIICITTDSTSKTATGTIAIQVEDFNDHCPKLTTTTHTMCLEDNVIYVSAVDEDEFPNSAPFDFTVIHESSKGKWNVEPLNETAAILRDKANLWPGTYKVAVEVKDNQGKSCADVQVMDVIVCTCAENIKLCAASQTKTSGFGASGVLLLLLGLLLLLLVPLLLLFCLCGGAAAAGDFKAIPFDTKQQLISYHTEGQGEDKSHEKDALMIYDYEGRESLAGSVGCCSLLENDNDLAFLDDLGPKFKTLAEICKRSTLVTESVDAGVFVSPPRPVSPVRPSTHTHTHTETFRDRDHVNVNTLNTSNVASGQTMLIQQPTMYYAATPMYVVEQKPQMVLVSGTQQALGHVGSAGLGQGLMQVGGIQSSQGVVLVDRQVGMGGATGHVAQGHTRGTTSRSRKVLVVESGSSGGEQAAHLAQGYIQTGNGSAEHGMELRGQGMQVKSQTFSLGSLDSSGSHEDVLMAATPKVQGSQRVVVQRKKVSVTERNVESSTRA